MQITLRPHINVTPMIDVMLVLLIIFMVVVPLIATQVDLPIADQLPIEARRAGRNRSDHRPSRNHFSRGRGP